MDGQKKPKKETMDRISSFPDEILILVVSRLPLKEAARTSLLSRRWRHLWTHTPSLDFDHSKSFDRLYEVCPRGKRDRLRLQYMDMVDRVIAATQAPALDCFRVRFFLNSQQSEKIDRWVHFAMSRKAQELELLFLPALSECPLYKFPSPTSYTDGFEVLKSLRLFNIDIAPKDLTFLLAKCILLEELDIRQSAILTDLKIAPGPPLRLKRLALFPLAMNCCQTITIAAPTPDLTSLEFRQPLKILHIQYAPKLTNLHVFAPVEPSLVLHHLISYLPQIRTLSFTHFSTGWRELMQAMTLLPDMTCLKHLTLGVESFNDDIRLSVLTSLITKSPSLQHLTIKFIRPSQGMLHARPFHKGCHPSLRVIELRGFEGSENDIEMALYLLSTAASPEKLILDLRNPYMESNYAFGDPRKLGEVVNRVSELRVLMAPQVPLIVQLVDDHAASYIDGLH